MYVYTDNMPPRLNGSVVALGFFDGVHTAHRRLIRRAIQLAKEDGVPCVVCTFDRHPLSLLAPGKEPKLLMSNGEKLAVFEKLGADAAWICPFTTEIAGMDAEAFMRLLCSRLHPTAVVVGFNYSFGAGGKGKPELIQKLSEELGYRAVIIDAVKDAEETVSSTLIRSLLEKGDYARAGHLLEREE